MQTLAREKDERGLSAPRQGRGMLEAMIGRLYIRRFPSDTIDGPVLNKDEAARTTRVRDKRPSKRK